MVILRIMSGLFKGNVCFLSQGNVLARWSDLRYMDQFWVERAEFYGEPFGFVEARAKFHKTATNLAKKQVHAPGGTIARCYGS